MTGVALAQSWRLAQTKRRWQRRLSPLLALILICIAACGTSSTTTKSGQKPVLTVAGGAPATSLDPAKDALYNQRPLSYQGVLHLKADGTYGPGLATSWKYIEGSQNQAFEFTLRQNARFSDGSPLNAQAAKTWLDYYAQAKGPYVSYMGQISSFEAVGQWTVRIHLKAPNPVIPWLLSDQNNWGMIAAPSCVANPSVLATQTCGAGEYMLDPAQTVTNDHYTYVPNPYYYDKSQVNWSKIVHKVIVSIPSILQAMQAGQVDFAQGDPSTADAATSAGLTVARAPGGAGRFGFSWDVKGAIAKPLADQRVRQALNYAIDRKAIASAVLGKYGTGTSEMAAFDGIDPKYDNYYPYDVAKAKSLLAAAGYPNGFSIDNVIVGAYAGANVTNMTQAVARYLGDVGVKITLANYTTIGDYVRNVVGSPTAMIFTIFLANRPTFIQYNTFFVPGGNFDRTGGGFEDPDITSLAQAGAMAADPSTYWKQISYRAVTQAYLLPVFGADIIWFGSKKLKGVTASVSWNILNPADLTPK